MASRQVSKRLITLQKLIDIGVEKDKDISNLQIKDLKNIEHLTLADVYNIAEMQESIRTKGVIGFLGGKNNTKKEKEV